jgi:thiol:disulfide interchange protein DsbD
LISLFPSIIKIFPVPGKWLETFKEFMGFAMLLSCVWLLWILTSQINISSVMLIIAILIIISFFIWSLEKSNKSKITRAISLFGFLFSCIFSIYSADNSQKDLETVAWKDYSPNVLEEATSSGKPVFVSFTAAWCINCQFNSRVFLDKEIVNLFKTKDIQAIQCDWTNRSKDISDLLKSYGSASIPFYVYYPAGSREPIRFPSIITKNKIIKTIEFEAQK